MVWFSVFNMPVTSSMNMIRNVEKSKIYSERRVSSDILRVFLLSVYFFLFDIQLVLMDITAQTVPGYVHLTVNLIHVDTQTENVLVLRVGRVTIVPQVSH